MFQHKYSLNFMTHAYFIFLLSQILYIFIDGIFGAVHER